MQKLSRLALLALSVSSVPTLAFAGDLNLLISNGRVTLIAQNVTIRQILDEWARVGQTRIVNGDKLSGPPVTLELRDVPEGQALEAVLRSASGYVLAPRPTTALGPGLSFYDRIMILPTSRAPAVTEMAPAPFRPAPQPQAQPQVPQNADEEEQNEQPQPQAATPPGTQPMPGPPMAQPGQPGQTGQPVQQPVPLTAPRPGMLPQPPVNTQPNPYQPPPLPGAQQPPAGQPPAGQVPGQQPGRRPGGPGGAGSTP
jgi:hypothetical protein